MSEFESWTKKSANWGSKVVDGYPVFGFKTGSGNTVQLDVATATISMLDGSKPCTLLSVDFKKNKIDRLKRDYFLSVDVNGKTLRIKVREFIAKTIKDIISGELMTHTTFFF